MLASDDRLLHRLWEFQSTKVQLTLTNLSCQKQLVFLSFLMSKCDFSFSLSVTLASTNPPPYTSSKVRFASEKHDQQDQKQENSMLGVAIYLFVIPSRRIRVTTRYDIVSPIGKQRHSTNTWQVFVWVLSSCAVAWKPSERHQPE